MWVECGSKNQRQSDAQGTGRDEVNTARGDTGCLTRRSKTVPSGRIPLFLAMVLGNVFKCVHLTLVFLLLTPLSAGHNHASIAARYCTLKKIFLKKGTNKLSIRKRWRIKEAQATDEEQLRLQSNTAGGPKHLPLFSGTSQRPIGNF